MYNIKLVDYYTKAEIDSQLTDYTTVTYLQGNYMTTLSITEALMNNYATITLLVDNFYPKTEIDSALSDYITSAQIDDPYYTKSETDTTLSLYSPFAQILIVIANFILIIHLYHQLKQEHFITIKLKLIICFYPIVLVLMLIITFTLKLNLILY